MDNMDSSSEAAWIVIVEKN